MDKKHKRARRKPQPDASGDAPVIGVVGAESLLGRELVDVLESGNLPGQVKLLAAEEQEAPASGILTEREGEPIFIASLVESELAGARVVLLAGSAESSRKALAAIETVAGAAVAIDLTGALEDHPAARLRAPIVESGAETAAPSAKSAIYVIAHPAAIALALFLKQLVRAGSVRRVVCNIFEPVSERGKKGLDELQQQTVGLLSFKKLNTEVFDTQISFNMLPGYGVAAVRSLEDVESAVERHLATLLAGNSAIPMPSLRVAHAPVFHGYSFSLWVEFESRPTIADLAGALAGAHVDVRVKGEEAPSNVGMAGQSGIAVGAIAPDRNDARACWFWMAADNLRLAAENAVEVAREVLG